MEKYLNIVKFSRPNHNNPNSNVYDVREISGSIGDIIDNKWIVIEGGENVVRVANLYWIDLIETTEILDSPYLECCGVHEECFYNVYRYEVNHEALDKNITTSKYKIKSYTLSINGEQIGREMFPISTIIDALRKYEQKYNGIVSSLDGCKTVKEIVDEMIK